METTGRMKKADPSSPRDESLRGSAARLNVKAEQASGASALWRQRGLALLQEAADGGVAFQADGDFVGFAGFAVGAGFR